MRQDKSAILIQQKLVSLPRRVCNILTIIMLVSLAAFSHPALANGDLAYQKAKSSFEAGDVGSAVLWLEKAVGQGNMPAHLPLAAMYRDGHGVKLDYDRAVSLFTRAAEYGYPSAQFSLGVMYRLGQGVKRDHSLALKWYRMAANQGDAESQNSLGVAYEHGRGHKIDIETAFMWYEIAAKNGSRRGDNNRRRVIRKHTESKILSGKKRALTCISSDYKDCN